MRRRASVIVGTICFVLGCQIAFADSYYYESITRTTRQNGKPQQDQMRGWVDDEKVKIEFPEGGRDGRVQQGAYMLTNNGGQTIYMVDPKEKQYFEFDPAQMFMMVEDTGMMSIEFRDVSAEKLEESSGGSVLGHGTKRVKVRSQMTMEMNVMGMQRVTQMDSTQEVWMTPDVSNEAWTIFLKMMPSGGDVNSVLESAEEAGLTYGFPLKSNSVTKMTNRKGKTQTMTSEMEVTTLRQEAIAASTFEIPSDYTKLDMLPAEWGGEAGEAEGPMKSLKGMLGGKKKKKKGGN